MFKNVLKTIIVLPLLSNINSSNAMNSLLNQENNDKSIEMQAFKSKNTSNKKQVLRKTSPKNQDKKKEKILMDLYRFSMDDWKQKYKDYFFEDDDIAYDKNYNAELLESAQTEILMDLYNYPINKWKQKYKDYSFENDELAYNKKYSIDTDSDSSSNSNK